MQKNAGSARACQIVVALNTQEADMRHIIRVAVLAIAALAIAGNALATGYPWRNHAAPYASLFGNEIDAHQQTAARTGGSLAGFLYVHYTGQSTTDGLPIVQHADCATMTCDVGWTVDGLPANAALYHVDGDHPVPVNRAEIPQPGAYVHFHWLGAAPLAMGDIKSGYLLELRAVARFCFIDEMGTVGSGSCSAIGGVAVVPGLDIATHVNIVGSFPGIDPPPRANRRTWHARRLRAKATPANGGPSPFRSKAVLDRGLSPGAGQAG
jgi:hypothetical protein